MEAVLRGKQCVIVLPINEYEINTTVIMRDISCHCKNYLSFNNTIGRHRYKQFIGINFISLWLIAIFALNCATLRSILLICLKNNDHLSNLKKIFKKFFFINLEPLFELIFYPPRLFDNEMTIKYTQRKSFTNVQSCAVNFHFELHKGEYKRSIEKSGCITAIAGIKINCRCFVNGELNSNYFANGIGTVACPITLT